jgi:nucleotide-binding universal stress UspA family protein
MRLQQIVAGTDFSVGAKQAIAMAVRLATSVAGTVSVTLVHVCEHGADERDDERRMRESAEALSEIVATYRQRGAELTAILRGGTPWEKLDNVAAEVGAGLIVIGRHGGGRGGALPIGSVAERLVRSASRPVLTVPCDFARLDVEPNAPDRH